MCNQPCMLPSHPGCSYPSTPSGHITHSANFSLDCSWAGSHRLKSYIIQLHQKGQSARCEELLDTKILELNLLAFAYRLFHEDFSS